MAVALVWMGVFVVVGLLVFHYVGGGYHREIALVAATLVAAWSARKIDAPALSEARLRTGDLAIVGAMWVVASIGVRFVFMGTYVLPTHDGFIAPYLAQQFALGVPQRSIENLQEVLGVYPPGYALLLSPLFYVLDAPTVLYAFKQINLVLLTTLPLTWAWLAWRLFFSGLRFWQVAALAYLAFFGLERTLMFGLAFGGKQVALFTSACLPLVVGTLLLERWSRWRWFAGTLTLAGIVLMHYQSIFVVATLLGALLVAYPRRYLRLPILAGWASAGLGAMAITVALVPSVLAAPRMLLAPEISVAAFWADISARRSHFWAIFHDGPFGLEDSPWRGASLVAMVVVLACGGWLLRVSGGRKDVAPEREFPAFARFAAFVLLVSVLLGSEVLPLGIARDYVRWYVWIFEALLVTGLLALLWALVARRGAGLWIAAAMLALFVALGLRWAALDAKAARVPVVNTSVQRDELDAIASALEPLTRAGPCAFIAPSINVPVAAAYLKRPGAKYGVEEYHYLTLQRVMDLAQYVTPCVPTSGTFLSRSMPAGRVLGGNKPTPALLEALRDKGVAVAFAGTPEEQREYQRLVAEAGYRSEWTPLGSSGNVHVYRLQSLTPV